MHTERNDKKSTWPIWFCLAVALAIGWPAWIQDTSHAAGQQRSQPPLQHFKSGGERSEILLREIDATLKRIDERLLTIEKAAQAWQGRENPASREAAHRSRR